MEIYDILIKLGESPVEELKKLLGSEVGGIVCYMRMIEGSEVFYRCEVEWE